MNVKIKAIFISLFLFLTISVNSFAYSVIPCGEAVGVIVRTKGVLVAGTSKVTDVNGHSINPAKKAGILKGDRIVSANGEQINTSEELSETISKTSAKIHLTVIRNNKTKSFSVEPVATTDGMKLGILVRDSTAGIGTVTYIDPSTGEFAGLGHGICDLDTNDILPINGGNILECELSSPTKGKCGVPGELNGEFIDQTIGSINSNTTCGISGFLNEIPNETSVDLASPDEVRVGDAYIYSEVDGDGVEKFSVNILNINERDINGKNLTIEITDKRLISKTGGIVQGMSGSPILQDGKIVGAITHVFVNNPMQGYGTFIQNMLKSDN